MVEGEFLMLAKLEQNHTGTCVTHNELDNELSKFGPVTVVQ